MDRAELNDLILYINRQIKQSFVLFVHGDGGMMTIQDAVRSTLSSQMPTVIYPGAALSAGSGAEAAHYDHQHTFYSNAPAVDIGDANSAGNSLWYVSRADHVHRLPNLSPSPAGTYGSATKVAVVTIDAKGRVTAASESTISAYTLPTPGTLTVSTTNVASGAHTHAITSSSDVSAGTSALLASSSGNLTLKYLLSTTAAFGTASPPVGYGFATIGGFRIRQSSGDLCRSDLGVSGNVMTINAYNDTTGLPIEFLYSALKVSLFTGSSVRSFQADDNGYCWIGSTGSSFSSGLRVRGADHYNTIYLTSGDLAVTVDSGYNIILGAYSGLATIFTGSAATSTVQNALTLKHNSTGTPAAGFGSGLLWTLESSTTADQQAALDTVLWTDATHATRTALRRNTTTGNATNTGYQGFWNHSAVAGTALTVIPNATGDVTKLLTCLYTCAEVTGTDVGGGVAVLAPGESTVICSDATNILTLAVAADGSVTVQRTAGTDTFKVALSMTWI